MKFLRLSIVALLLSSVFIACEKQQDNVVQAKSIEKPVPVPIPVEGKWMGVRMGMDRSIPVYFGFHIKSGGTLDVLNKDKLVIGTGTWVFTNEVLKVKYTLLSPGGSFSIKS